jgi:hypothetical protein
MNGVGRVGSKDDVTRAHGSEHEVGETFLGPYGRDSFFLRVNLHAPPPPVPIRNGVPEFGDACRCGVPVILRFFRRLYELFHNVARGRDIRISHSQIYDVDPLAPEFDLELVHHLEHIRRQTVHSPESLHASTSPYSAVKT